MGELGYVPSRTAQNLAHGTTRAVGLLVPDIANGFFADVAKGVEQTVIERGYSTVLCNTGWNFERELFYLEALKSHAVDGVVYAAGALAESSELTGVLAGLPVVAVDEELGDIPACTVVSDNAAGGRLVAEHLTDLGHQRALIIGVNRSLASAMQRVTGFTGTWLRRAGSQPGIADGSFEEGYCGYRTVREHLAEITSSQVTALFALNDLKQRWARCGRSPRLACRSRRTARRRLRRHLHRASRPGLTTVRQDAVGLGSAPRKVLDILGGSTIEPRRVLDVELVERHTTAAPSDRRREPSRADGVHSKKAKTLSPTSVVSTGA